MNLSQGGVLPLNFLKFPSVRAFLAYPALKLRFFVIACFLLRFTILSHRLLMSLGSNVRVQPTKLGQKWPFSCVKIWYSECQGNELGAHSNHVSYILTIFYKEEENWGHRYSRSSFLTWSLHRAFLDSGRKSGPQKWAGRDPKYSNLPPKNFFSCF